MMIIVQIENSSRLAEVAEPLWTSLELIVTRLKIQLQLAYLLKDGPP